MEWSSVVTAFGKGGVMLTGGNGATRHCLTTLSVRLTAYLMCMFKYNHSDLNRALEFNYKY